MNEHITAGGIIVPHNVVSNTQVTTYTKENQLADNYLSEVINAAQDIFKRSGGQYGISPDGKRNYNQLFGYGDVLCYRDYKDMFKRGGIANTVVAKLPKMCWRDAMEIMVNDKPILEDEIAALTKYGFLDAMERADICNRIGRYSALFVGVPDGLDPWLPVGSAKAGDIKGLYFNVYEEDGIEVAEYERDPASPRYNKPLIYILQTTDSFDSKLQGSVKAIRVHYSRVIHFAEGALSNSLEGCSSLEAPWNAITDKMKVSGSSGEANFKNSRQKIVLSAREGSKFNPNDVTALKENAEAFQNNQEDFLRTKNMDTTAIQPAIASPRDAFDINVEEVSGTTGIPVRVFGRQVANVAGSEDKATLNALVNDRQNHECTPMLLCGLQILADASILDLPENAVVVWPKQSSLSEKEQSEVNSKKAGAIKSIFEALSTIGADEVVVETVFKAAGFEGIQMETADFDNKDNEVSTSIGGS